MRIATLIAAALVLTACAHQPERKPVEAQQALNQGEQVKEAKRPPLPESVRASLRPTALESSRASEQLLAQPRFSVNANGIAASDFLPVWLLIRPTISWFIRM